MPPFNDAPALSSASRPETPLSSDPMAIDPDPAGEYCRHRCR